jgi:hypothetical protein
LPVLVLSLEVVLLYIEGTSGTSRQIVSSLSWRVIGRLWGVFWRYFVSLVAGLLALGLPVLILYVSAPKSLAFAVVGIICGLILLLFWIVLLPVLSLASVMCVTENATPFRLIRRATRLVAKQWPKALVFVVFFALWFGLVFMISEFIVSSIHLSRESTEYLVLEGAVGFLTTVASLGVMQVFPALMYVEARCRLESFHLETLRQ